jgi:outer membrane protein TolC
VRGLNRLLNRPLDTPVEAVPEDALDLPLPLTREEVVAQGLARREELREAASGVDAAGAQVRLSNAAFLPSIAVALDYGFQGRDLSFGPDDDYWTASVLVSWSLFNGGQDAARRDAAQAGLRQLELRRQEAEEEIRRDIVEAYEAARVARTSIATAQDRLAAARRSFELVRRRYEEGLASPVEFLDARTTLTRAELNRAITLHQYAIRWVDLERAAALRDIRPMEINR